MTTPLRDQILTTLAIYDRMHRLDLVKVVQSHPGCENPALVQLVIDMLIEEGAIGCDFGISSPEDVLFHIETAEPSASWWDEFRYSIAIVRYRLRKRWWAVRAWIKEWIR